MGSRGFGASRRNSRGRLGSVSDYCVHHCVCPVVVVRDRDERERDGSSLDMKIEDKPTLPGDLQPVLEEQEEGDAPDEKKGQ